MRLAAALFSLIFVWRACQDADDLVPLGIACLVAFVVLAIVATQLQNERAPAGERTVADPSLPTPERLRRAEVANDNATREGRAS